MVVNIKTYSLLVTVMSAILLSSTSQAAQRYVFKVIDQNGVSLNKAVIEPFSNGATSHQQIESLRTIDQIDKQFSPQQIIISKGDSVEFPNSDNIRHHVYSFSKAKVFELKLYANKPERPVRFGEPGIVVLGCNIHDSMIGYVYVASTEKATETDHDGRAEIESTQALKTVQVWHAQQANGAESLQLIDIDTLSTNAEGEFVIKMKTTEPAPRNSFKDVFGVEPSN